MAADTGYRPSSWPAPTASRRSTASTITTRRSIARRRSPTPKDRQHGVAAASAHDFPGDGYYWCFFDSLRDMVDPVGDLRHVRDALAPDGTVLLVDAATRSPTLNRVGRNNYAASTLICTPCSLDQHFALALGARAGEVRLARSLGRPASAASAARRRRRSTLILATRP